MVARSFSFAGMGSINACMDLAQAPSRLRLLRVESPSDDARTMALFAAGLFIGGTVLGALTLLLPHPSDFDDPALVTNLTASGLMGALLLVLAGRLPVWALQAALAMGTVLVTRAIFYSHEPNAYYAFFYIWVVFYSFYFFGRLGGLLQIGLIGIAYGWVLLATNISTPFSRWLMAVVSLAGAGLLLDLLGARLRQRESEAIAHARALDAVGSVAHELALRTTIESAAPAICDAAVKVTGAAGVSLWRPTADGGGLEATAATDDSLVGSVVLLTGEPSGAIRAFNTRQNFFVAEARESGEVDSRLIEKMGVASILFAPIMREETPIGVLVLYWDHVIAAPEKGSAEIIALLAAEASIAIERTELLTRLERAARTDDLTGLPNRRAWDEHLARELARAERLDAPLCVAMLDLDHFKQYNDRFGHQAGDRFLKEAAAAWQARTRESDLVARYGGEEFAVAVLDCELAEAAELLESLREQTPEGASCSVGLAQWDRAESPPALVARADAALYEAKRRGRDRVISG
jgi:diguanylate cyclase (GGDEF)-like protein